MPDTELPCRRAAGALLIRVRLTPKGGRDSVDGLAPSPAGTILKARVRAAPEDGAANTALLACVAQWLDVPTRDVTLSSGHRSRTKLLSITGDPDKLEARLKTALDGIGN